MIIAYASNIKELRENQPLHTKSPANFVGLAWLPIFIEKIEKKGHFVKPASVVLRDIKKGKILPKDVLVIQEHDDKFGIKLLKMGCIPLILLGGESCIYAYKFYDHINKIASLFENRVLFKGDFQLFNCSVGNNYLCTFPVLVENNVTDMKDWKTRKEIVLVAANKYYKIPLKRIKNPIRLVFRFYKSIDQYCSLTWRKGTGTQLHNKRLDLIIFFGNEGKLDLFGMDWDKKNILPSRIEKMSRRTLDSIYKGKVENKIDVISNYKYAICYENQIYPGYITEKIIDCFIAGVIPIYLGAPDIQEHIPKNTYIDVREFDDFDALAFYLKNLTEIEALQIIRNGREFLLGHKEVNDGGFSIEGYSEFILNIVMKKINELKN